MTYRIYVNSMAAHDCSDATLATATSQLKAYGAMTIISIG